MLVSSVKCTNDSAQFLVVYSLLKSNTAKLLTVHIQLTTVAKKDKIPSKCGKIRKIRNVKCLIKTRKTPTEAPNFI